MPEITKELLARLIALFEKDGGKINGMDATVILAQIIDMVKEETDVHEKSIYNEIIDIHHKIETVKQELSEKMPDGKVPEATKELDAVMQSTEDATNKILDSAERIREALTSMDDKVDGKKLIEEEVVKIFEACNFQDITGQRIKKVTSALQYIEGSVGKIIKTFGIETAPVKAAPQKKLSEISDKELMNGPQLDTDKPSQAEVDKLFDNA